MTGEDSNFNFKMSSTMCLILYTKCIDLGRLKEEQAGNAFNEGSHGISWPKEAVNSEIKCSACLRSDMAFETAAERLCVQRSDLVHREIASSFDQVTCGPSLVVRSRSATVTSSIGMEMSKGVLVRELLAGKWSTVDDRHGSGSLTTQNRNANKHEKEQSPGGYDAVKTPESVR